MFQLLPLLLLATATTLLVGPSLINAEHALSEVWNESEGLQMKYSTDHDDLLSTKGSDLHLKTSLPTSGQGEGESSKQVITTSGGEAAAASNDDGGEKDSADGDSNTESQSAEEGADSNERSNRVPMSNQKVSTLHRFNKLDQPEAVASKQVKSGSIQSYESALEQVDGADEQMANVDHGSQESDLKSKDSPNLKFHQPGRKFKEAVKLAPNSKGEEEDEEESNKNGESEGEFSTSGETVPELNREAKSEKDIQSSQSSENDPENGNNFKENDEQQANLNQKDFELSNDFNEAGSKQNLDRLNQQSERFATRPGVGSEMANLLDAGLEDLGALDGDDARREGSGSFQQRQQQAQMNFQNGRFFSDQQAGFRSLASNSNSNLISSSGPNSRDKSANAPVFRSNAAVAKLPTAYKQLSYFKNVNQQAKSANNGSPDSVRDNFISPGHFPGSMPHLNVAAASETHKKELSPSKVEAKSEPKSSQETSLATNQRQQETKPVGEPVMAASLLQPAATTIARQQVTPEPALEEPESQMQIMAPILVSTTTMAPQVSLSLATTLAPAANSTLFNPVPSLKRFKSRQYR